MSKDAKTRAGDQTPPKPNSAKPGAAAKAEEAPQASRRWRQRILILFSLAAVAALTWVFWPKPEVDLTTWLGEREFEINSGFSGHYQPGTVVRTHRPNDNGTLRRLARPEIVFWPDRCFPGKKPRSSEFPLPKSTGKRSAKLGFGMEKSKPVLPSLSTEGAKSWEIEFTEPRHLAFAQSDLDEQFSDYCLDRFEQLFDAGTDPASMATILEAVVADGLRITVDWQAGVDGQGATKRTAEKLKSEEINVKAELVASHKTVLEAEGLVVVAYKVAGLVLVTEE